MPEPYDRAALPVARAVRAAVRPSHRRWPSPALALALGAAALAVAARYPLDPALFLLGLIAYAALLWRWPILWLIIVPAALPAFDFAPWTGWVDVGEPDLVVLATLAVLMVRAPPARADWRMGKVATVSIAASALATLIGAIIGLLRPGPIGGTVIAELDPFDALRIAKGFVLALVLLPFLRRAVRTQPHALACLAIGMSAGLALVAAATVWERAVFTGPFDFHTVYRVVATFASMHFGGGYVGVYVAMALPFLFVVPYGRHGLGMIAALAAAAGALYALVVTYQRSAYASAVIASLVVVAARLGAARQKHAPVRALALPLVLMTLVGGMAALAATDARFMVRRLDETMPDLATRLSEWRAGLALESGDAGPALFGMGLGTFARILRAHRPPSAAPTNVALEHEAGRPYLEIDSGLPLYVGQKVRVQPFHDYRIAVRLRAPAGRARVIFLLCEKLLLYSVNCRAAVFVAQGGAWRDFAATIDSGFVAARSVLGLKRPVELSFFVPEPGARLDVADVRFTDARGPNLLTNGDFTRGTTRWYFTDDDHTVWRIENQYLMTLFETGAFGLAAFVLLAAVSLSAAWRAARQGDAIAPALAAAIAAFLASGLFDCPLDVPRLATLFYLIAFAALAADAPTQRARPLPAGLSTKLVEPGGIEPPTSTMPL